MATEAAAAAAGSGSATGGGAGRQPYTVRHFDGGPMNRNSPLAVVHVGSGQGHVWVRENPWRSCRYFAAKEKVSYLFISCIMRAELCSY